MELAERLDLSTALADHQDLRTLAERANAVLERHHEWLQQQQQQGEGRAQLWAGELGQ